MISREEVKRIAYLARIKLSEEEIEKFQEEFSSILDYFALLEQLDVSQVKEMTHSVKRENVSRSDVVKEAVASVKEKLLQTSEQKDGLLKVPSVLSYKQMYTPKE